MFRNLLIADSGTGHVEEMIRMLQDIPQLQNGTRQPFARGARTEQSGL